MFEFEKLQLQNKFDFVVGVDEVGRGCLAGPVVAGAVVFNFENLPSDGWITKVKDSKLISPAKRTELDSKIRENAHAWGIGMVEPGVVDKLNVHQATLLAMHKAVQEVLKKLSRKSKILAVIDGKFTVPQLTLAQEAVIDGDDKVFSISAASILAKVYRDNLMVELGTRFPEYGFAQHKGYGTKQHCAAIEKHGLSIHHRKTFCSRFSS